LLRVLSFRALFSARAQKLSARAQKDTKPLTGGLKIRRRLESLPYKGQVAVPRLKS
jgi:hypothetical protein